MVYGRMCDCGIRDALERDNICILSEVICHYWEKPISEFCSNRLAHYIYFDKSKRLWSGGKFHISRNLAEFDVFKCKFWARMRQFVAVNWKWGPILSTSEGIVHLTTSRVWPHLGVVTHVQKFSLQSVWNYCLLDFIHRAEKRALLLLKEQQLIPFFKTSLDYRAEIFS